MRKAPANNPNQIFEARNSTLKKPKLTVSNNKDTGSKVSTTNIKMNNKNFFRWLKWNDNSCDSIHF